MMRMIQSTKSYARGNVGAIVKDCRYPIGTTIIILDYYSKDNTYLVANVEGQTAYWISRDCIVPASGSFKVDERWLDYIKGENV